MHVETQGLFWDDGSEQEDRGADSFLVVDSEEVVVLALKPADRGEGFILRLLGHIPRRNEQLRYKLLKIVITEMKGQKIEKILVTREKSARSGEGMKAG